MTGAKSIFSFTHATVDQLKEHLGKLTGPNIPLEYEDLSDIIRDPESLTGMYIAHQWADETHQRDWYYGQLGKLIDLCNFSFQNMQKPTLLVIGHSFVRRIHHVCQVGEVGG